MASVDLTIGGGLVEIAALATLIGATTAQSLVLGSRGAAGLPFAAMSLFGTPFLIKACVSACTPSWLRETMGVKDIQSDAAVGSKMGIERVTQKGFNRGNIAGLSVTLSKRGAWERSQGATGISSSLQYVHAFDEYSSTILRNCMSTEQGAPPRFVRYLRTSQWKELRRQRSIADWLSMFGSMIKLAEALMIWYKGSTVLALLTLVNWGWFFLCAIVLQLTGLSREHANFFDALDETNTSQGNCYDYLAGELPSVQSSGQYRKVIFNVPPSVRNHILWRLTWVFGAIICTGSLTATYILMGAQPKPAAVVWLCFQVMWTIVRSVYFYFAQETEGIQHGVPKLVRDWELGQYGLRILSLASGVSRYQILLHPRMPYSYTEDIQDPTSIFRLIKTCDHVSYREDAMPSLVLEGSGEKPTTASVEIKAVIGDTLLSSIAWLLGSPYTSMDLYDCCLVAIGVAGRTVMIPSVRVLSGHVSKVREPRTDPEAGIVGEHTPKAVGNDGTNTGWVFWIPLDTDRWLYFVGDLDFIGKQSMEVLSSDEVSKRLGLADLFVSLRGVQDVKDALEKSRVVGQLLTDLLKDHDESITFKHDPPPYGNI